MRILVLGAGAIGGYFGARLIEGGGDVTYLVRPGRAAQLKRDGLVVESCFGNLALKDLKITEKASQPFDLILLSCKAYDLDTAVAAIRPAVGENTTVLPLLNGMKHISELEKQFDKERVLGGFCIISTTLDDNGKIIHYNNAHTLKFGEFSGEETERIKAIKAAFEPAIMDWKASNNIARDMWEKWVMISSLAATTCLMRANVGQVARSPGGVAFAEQLFDECISVFRATGHEVRDEFVTNTRSRSTDTNSTLMASMLRDVERGSKVEADQILGDLIANAESRGVQTPLLRLAYCHLKSYELRKSEA